VRQAVAHAMDQQGFLDLVNFGKGRQSWAMPPWLGDWAVPESEFPAYDPAESIALLSAAGYPDGIEVTDSVFTGYDFYSVATQEQLAAANIKTNIELSEFGVWYGNVYSGGNYEFCTTGDFQFENPDRNIRTYYHSKGTLNNTFLHETDPDAVAELDKLLDDARRLLDVEEQKAMLGDAQRWMFENVPAAYGGYIYTVILVQGRLQNFNIQPAYTTGGLQGMQFGYMWVNDA
jgi:ABC-type transport system substrate-binding protein